MYCVTYASDFVICRTVIRSLQIWHVTLVWRQQSTAALLSCHLLTVCVGLVVISRLHRALLKPGADNLLCGRPLPVHLPSGYIMFLCLSFISFTLQ